MLLPHVIQGVELSPGSFSYGVSVTCPRCGQVLRLSCTNPAPTLTLTFEAQSTEYVVWQLKDHYGQSQQSASHPCSAFAHRDHTHAPTTVSRDDEIISLLQQIKRTGDQEDALRAQIALLTDKLEYAQNDLLEALAKIENLEAQLRDLRAEEDHEREVRGMLADPRTADHS